jgi:hypothetical protein
MNRKLFAIAAIVAILVVAIPTVIAALTYQIDMPAVIIINPSASPAASPSPTPKPTTVSIQICDLNGSTITKIDLGTASKPGYYSTEFMVKNTGNVPVNVTLTNHAYPMNNQTVPGEGEAHGYWWHWDSQGNIIPVGGNMIAIISFSYNMIVGDYNVPMVADLKFTATEA